MVRHYIIQILSNLLYTLYFSSVVTLLISTCKKDPQCTPYLHLYLSQKQLPRKMKTRLVIIECAGYTFSQLFFWRFYFTLHLRLKEFSETASSRLSIEEFESVDLGEEEDPPAFKASKEKHKLKEVC